MGPEKQVKYRQIGCQIKYALPAIQAVNQWDTDETAISIDGAKTFDTPIALLRNQQVHQQNLYRKGSGGYSHGQKQVVQQLGIIIHLVGYKNHHWVDNHQQKIRQLSNGRIIQQTFAIAQQSQQED